MRKILKKIQRLLRWINGEDAYESYVKHWQSDTHSQGCPMLSRRAFFQAEQDRKWSRVNRCC